MVLALLLGVLASTWQAIRATRAEHEQRELRVKSDAARREATAAKDDAMMRAYAAVAAPSNQRAEHHGY